MHIYMYILEYTCLYQTEIVGNQNMHVLGIVWSRHCVHQIRLRTKTQNGSPQSSWGVLGVEIASFHCNSLPLAKSQYDLANRNPPLSEILLF